MDKKTIFDIAFLKTCAIQHRHFKNCDKFIESDMRHGILIKPDM